jgi:DNA anti-recombination protein RmuC
MAVLTTVRDVLKDAAARQQSEQILGELGAVLKGHGGRG